MNLKEHSVSRIGFFSKVYGEYSEPQWKILNLKKLKEINNERKPPECSRTTVWEEISFDNSSDCLIQFLLSRELITLNEIPKDKKEFNLICESDILFEMLIHDQQIPETEKKFTFCQKFNQNNYVIERITGESEAESIPSKENRSFSFQLTKQHNPDGSEAQVYVVVRHQYKFTNEITANLYISKEIDAVHHVGIESGFDEGKDLSSLVLLTQPYHKIATSAILRKFNNKLIFSDYLAGGLIFLFGIMPNISKEVQKVTIMDNINKICRLGPLDDFKRRLAEFVYFMAECNITEGILLKTEGLEFIPKEENPNSKKYWIPVTSLYEWEQIPDIKYEPKDNSVAILGKKVLDVPKDLYFYKTDFISLENYKSNLFENIHSNVNYIFIGSDVNEHKEFEERRKRM